MKNIVKRHIIYFFIICLFLFLFAKFNITCPIYCFLKVPCPTCGVTRAIISLVNFDLQNYLFFQPFAIFLLIAVILLIHVKLFKRKNLIYFFSFFILILNLLYYFFKNFLWG